MLFKSRVKNDKVTGEAELVILSTEDNLPPFRSAKDFPIKPKEDKLIELYDSCRNALVDSNAARTLLRQRRARKKDVIAAIRSELERVEADLALEAGTRMQLHEMNQKLIGVLKEMDSVSNDIAITVEGAHTGRRSDLKALIDKIKSIVRNWRIFKRATISNEIPSARQENEKFS